MTRRSLEELIFHMPAVARDAPDAWARDFAASIIRQSKRRHWKPTDKQEGVMRRLVGELFSEPEELEVIES